MYRPEWLKYSQEQRAQLAEHYKMKLSTSVEVMGNTLVCDGYPDESIYLIDKKEADELLGLGKVSEAKKDKEEVIKEVIEKKDAESKKEESNENKGGDTGISKEGEGTKETRD